MLLTLITCQLFAFAVANPFHKYPFVFLLDVGNEDLENNTPEQIRVSAPGGSIAVRYPGIGYEKTIGHIRVSGIDFGTDLKANIVDGGPGYNYVVLVFMGNPGTPYNAVVTIQTVVDNSSNIQRIDNVMTSEHTLYQAEEDDIDSAKDSSDLEFRNDVRSKSARQYNNVELMQSSSNVYSFVDNESLDNDEPSDESSNTNEGIDGNIIEESHVGQYVEDGSNTQEIRIPYVDDTHEEETNSKFENIELNSDDDNDENVNSEQNFDGNQQAFIDRNTYSNNKALNEHLLYGNNIYAQEELQNSARPIYQEDPMDYEDTYAEENNDEADKYRDSNNNNYVDNEDSYAVSY